jgi:hypothetical protein
VKPFLAMVGGFVVSMGMFGSGLLFAAYLIAGEPEHKPRSDQNVAELWTQKPRPVDPSEQDFERMPGTAVASKAVASETVASDREPGRRSEPSTGMEVAMANTGTVSDAGIAGESTSAGIDRITTGMIGADADSAQSMDAITVTNLSAGEDEPADVEVIRPSASGQEEEPPTLSETEDRQQAPSAQLKVAHVEWCFDKYRSYRPETNSYTPYSGGQEPCVSPYLKGLATAAASQPQASPGPGGSVILAGDPSAAPADPGQGSVTYITYEHVQDCLRRYRSYRPEDNTYQPYGGGPREQCR